MLMREKGLNPSAVRVGSGTQTLLDLIEGGRENYLAAVTPGAEKAQNYLMGLVDDRPGGIGPATRVQRMAASPKMLALLQTLPALGGAGIAINAMSQPSEEEIVARYLAERGMV